MLHFHSQCTETARTCPFDSLVFNRNLLELSRKIITMAAAMRSVDPNCWQSADCRKLGSLEPEIITRFCFSERGLFTKNTGKRYFGNNPTSQKLLFPLLRGLFSTSEKLSSGHFFPPPLLLCSPACLFFLAAFYLEIRLLGDGVHGGGYSALLSGALPTMCQAEGPVHLHH